MDVYSYLCYGFPIDGEGYDTPLPWVIDEEDEDNYPAEFSDYYLKKLGYSPKNMDWKELKPIIEKSKVEILAMGSCDYSTYYLIITDSLQQTEWDGAPVSINKLIWNTLLWNDKLKQFCKVVGIEYKKPEWILGCYTSY